jgi:N-acyl-phosphatidylethanolamine-hydrolysing phospholipase D
MPKRFRNPWPHDEHGVLDILRWKCGLPPREHAVMPDAPDQAAHWQAADPARLARPPRRGWRATWLGHASFLLQSPHASLLVDPVFSDYCSPLPIPGLKRHRPPPLSLGDLPSIDAVLLTHSHYDHLDLPTLHRLGLETQLVVPEGHSNWLKRRGFSRVRELAWHERQEIRPGIHVTATPAQHFTARSLTDRNCGHWCGWFLEGSGVRLWHAGDTGWFPEIGNLAKNCGEPDFAMIPIGAYQPRHIMKAMHMNPEEAVDAFVATGCRRAVAMHWGTFRLTDEPLGEPPLRLQAELARRGIPAQRFIAGSCGQSWCITGKIHAVE